MEETKITFLGVAAVLPGAGQDTASYLIDGTVLIDCGWYAALKMQQYGYDPVEVRTLILTHCHHDHYMGLPGLLFYRAMRSRREEDRPPLRITGPPDDLPLVVELSRRFLQEGRFGNVAAPVELAPLEPGRSFQGDGWTLETIRALHPVTGICARFTSEATGRVIALSGDTGPNPELARLARSADLLIHEASVPPERRDDELRGDHSRAQDAARTALEAGVGSLRLVHIHGGHGEASLRAAREIFGESYLGQEGETLVFTG